MAVPHVRCGWMLSALLALGCGSRTEVASKPAPVAEQNESEQRTSKPPSFTFAPPIAWHSRRAEAPAIDPPDLTRETWSVLVNQNAPLQAKTPRWQALPTGET